LQVSQELLIWAETINELEANKKKPKLREQRKKANARNSRECKKLETEK